MTNDEDLCDQSDVYLKGTGKGDFESCTVDKYIKQDAREGFQIKILTEEMFNFLYNKYGGDVIKRYYI